MFPHIFMNRQKNTDAAEALGAWLHPYFCFYLNFNIKGSVTLRFN